MVVVFWFVRVGGGGGGGWDEDVEAGEAFDVCVALQEEGCCGLRLRGRGCAVGGRRQDCGCAGRRALVLLKEGSAKGRNAPFV